MAVAATELSTEKIKLQSEQKIQIQKSKTGLVLEVNSEKFKHIDGHFMMMADRFNSGRFTHEWTDIFFEAGDFKAETTETGITVYEVSFWLMQILDYVYDDVKKISAQLKSKLRKDPVSASDDGFPYVVKFSVKPGCNHPLSFEDDESEGYPELPKYIKSLLQAKIDQKNQPIIPSESIKEKTVTEDNRIRHSISVLDDKSENFKKHQGYHLRKEKPGTSELATRDDKGMYNVYDNEGYFVPSASGHTANVTKAKKMINDLIDKGTIKKLS